MSQTSTDAADEPGVRILAASNRTRFVVVHKDTIEDERLSFRARGLLAYLLAKPPDWSVRADQLARHAREGRDAIRTALRELRTCGYLVTDRRQGSDGRWETVQVIHEVPVDGKGAAHTEDVFPAVGKPAASKPTTGKPTDGNLVAPMNTQERSTVTENPREASRDKSRSDRATRLVDGWHPAPEPELVAAIGGQQAAAREFDKFRDYWQAKGGKDARKTDWQATWRNWLRRSAENGDGKQAKPNAGDYARRYRAAGEALRDQQAQQGRML